VRRRSLTLLPPSGSDWRTRLRCARRTEFRRDFTGHLFLSRRHFNTRGRLVEGVEQIDALGEYRSLGALDSVTHELQLVGGVHEPAAK